MTALGIVAFVVALLLSVMLHEFGHFATAKHYGMKATKFFVGFGPTLWSRTKGETEYGVKAIPAGGFVKIIGMTPLEEVDPGDEERAFYKQPAGRRAVVLAAGSAMHFLIAIVLILGVVLTVGMAVAGPAVINTVSTCAPTDDPRAACAPGAPPGPARVADLQAGDRIVSIDGQPVANWDQASQLIRGHGAGKATVVVERDGKTLTLYPNLVAVQRGPIDNPTGEPKSAVGAMGVVGASTAAFEHPGFIAGVGDSAKMFGQLFTGTFEALGKLPASMGAIFRSSQDGGRDPNGAVGVVGAADVSGRLLSSEQPFSQRVAAFLLLIAGINVFVGIFNLLPLLPLDGGHLAVLGYEQGRDRVRRWRGYRGPVQRVDMNKLMPAAIAVIAVFVVMSVLLMSADILNPIRFNP